MKRVYDWLLTVVLVLGLCSCGQSPEAQWQEQYDLGVRYLSEGNYEEAIIAFTAAIEIDPKQPDAYLKTAEAYVAIGDIDSAIAALEQGYRQTQDEQIAEQLEMLQNSRVDYSEYFSEDMISKEEITIGGVPFYNLDLSEVQTLLSTTDSGDSSLSEIKDIDGNIVGKSYSVAHDGYVSVACEQFVESSTINELHYYGYYNGEFIEVETEIRGITAGDTLNEVLEMIGVNPEGARVLSELGRSIIIGDERLLEGGYGWIECTDETTSVDGVTGVMIYISMDNVQCQLDFIYGRLAILSCYSY